MIQVIDNFLDDNSSKHLHDGMLSSSFPWFLCDKIVLKQPTDNIQFTHIFYGEGEPKSQFYQELVNIGILAKLNASALVKVKSNIQLKSHSIIKNPLHVDNSHANCITGIYYVNTNNGYTYFENGEVVESICGRMVLFPSNMIHGGTTCTDQKYRCVINFNFYPV